MAAVAQSKRLKGRQYRAAVAKAKAGDGSATTDTEDKVMKQRSAQPLPSGLIPEVVINVRPGNKSLKGGKGSRASSTVEDPPASESDSDAPRKLKRRASAKRVLIIESESEDGSASEYDDNEEENPKKSKGISSSSRKAYSEGTTSQSSDYETDAIPKKSKRVSSSKASSRKSLSKGSTSQSSDYEESSTDTVSDEEQSAASSDDESVSSSKPKAKAKLKAPTKSKAQNKTSSRKALPLSSSDVSDGDEMDVDDLPPQAKQKATKRKAVDESERPAKKQKRVDSDPWKLESKPVQKDWTQMKAPPLEMFHFSRKVVDEYTYLDGKIHSLVTRIAAERHWVLSGTPPIHDFGALKTIATFLNLHLGIDDDAEGQSAEVKKRRREQTGKRS